jgi:hypothetical protein
MAAGSCILTKPLFAPGRDVIRQLERTPSPSQGTATLRSLLPAEVPATAEELGSVPFPSSVGIAGFGLRISAPIYAGTAVNQYPTRL